MKLKSIEDEIARRRAVARLVAVRERRGDPQAPLLAGDHELQPLRPPLDDAVEREADRNVARFSQSIRFITSNQDSGFHEENLTNI